MHGDVDLAAIGSLLADATRAAILVELLGGEPLAAGELARRTGASPSGASNHLKRLRDAGLVDVHVFGRERHYRLGSREVAEALEALGRIAPSTRARTLRSVERRRSLERARTCYDHLAGRLGVSFTERLLERGVMEARDASYVVTHEGTHWFRDEFGIDADHLATAARRFAYACPDLSEQRPHLAGALGTAVANAFFARGFVRRMPGSRALRVTRLGSEYLGAIGVKTA